MKKRIATLALAGVMTAAVFAGCGSSSASSSGESAASESTSATTESSKSGSDSSVAASETTTYPLTITDASGQSVTITEEPDSVVSIAPSNTEILFAIGAGDTVVGKTDYCNYPSEASSVQSIGTYTEPNTELILSMQPDVVFECTTSVNEDVTKQLEDNGIPVVILGGEDMDGVENDIRMAGQIMNKNSEADSVVSDMEQKRAEVKKAIAGQDAKSVFVDLGSYYSVGENTPIGSLLKEMNCTNIAAGAGTEYPQLSVEQIISSDPDVYVSLFTTVDELKSAPGIGSLSCIQNGNVVCWQYTDAESDMIQRPGPRMAEGMEVLAKAIYPDAF